MLFLNPRWFLALALPALACAEVYPEPASIAVYLGVDQQSSTSSLNGMKREVEALLKPAGIRIDWRYIDQANTIEEDHGNLYVLRVRGTCSTEKLHLLYSELGPYGDVAVLGSASTVGHKVQPFGNVECDPLRRSLATSLRGQPTSKRDDMFGKVLGRVMAHELFHMITGQSKHTDHGLFRSSQNVRDLATRDFQFTPSEARALRASIR